MARISLFLMVISSLASTVYGQTTAGPRLFSSTTPLHIKATGSIKSIKKNTNDSTFNSGLIHYEVNSGQWDSIKVKARVRGNFRRRTCYFPPLRIKISKRDSKNTLFDGNKSLKLVLPCKTTKDNNQLILKEYICYLFYQQVTLYHFQTRLANLDLTETSSRKKRNYNLLCFFIEDDQHVAERTNASVVKDKKIHPIAYDATLTARHDFFQYMIGNTDWSTTFEHNSNSIFIKPDKFIPLAYDFDMSGFINAPYAQDNAPTLGTGDIRERLYRGFCRDEKVMNNVRKEFLALEPTINATINQYASEFSDYDLEDMHQYLNQFFEILKDDQQFKSKILEGCRTK